MGPGLLPRSSSSGYELAVDHESTLLLGVRPSGERRYLEVWAALSRVPCLRANPARSSHEGPRKGEAVGGDAGVPSLGMRCGSAGTVGTQRPVRCSRP